MKTYQTAQLKLEVAAKLAENPDLIISSSSNDEVNAMMMCDAVLNSIKPGQPINRSQVTSPGEGEVGYRIMTNLVLSQLENRNFIIDPTVLIRYWLGSFRPILLFLVDNNNNMK